MKATTFLPVLFLVMALSAIFTYGFMTEIFSRNSGKGKLTIWEWIKLFVRFPLGCRVTTRKGCRIRGVCEGRVKGYGTWRNYKAVNIKKADGKTVQCLAKNLVRI